MKDTNPAKIIRVTTGITPGVGSDKDAEIVVDAAASTLKFGTPAGAKEAVDLSSTQTITGTKSFTGATTMRGVTVTGTAAVTITAADSGTVYIATKATQSPDQIFTLPAASTNGLTYTFICGHASGEITVAVGTGDNIVGKTHGAENGTGISTTVTTGILINTASTNVVGDYCTLQSDGTTTWFMTAVAGVWAGA